jgi:hypothetical protein
MLTSSNWKERNAGVLEVEAILREANSRISPNVGELLGAMKVRRARTGRGRGSSCRTAGAMRGPFRHDTKQARISAAAEQLPVMC